MPTKGARITAAIAICFGRHRHNWSDPTCQPLYFEPVRSICKCTATARHQHDVRSEPDVARSLKILATVPVSTSVKAFRHFIDGSLALASPDHTCQNLVPAFLQRSPQPLLTAAACSGLMSAPDCRPRGAHPHLSHSTTSPYPGDVFVTHGACGP
jgi:hypothetical protein